MLTSAGMLQVTYNTLCQMAITWKGKLMNNRNIHSSYKFSLVNLC